jgi:hypothetical protein
LKERSRAKSVLTDILNGMALNGGVNVLVPYRPGDGKLLPGSPGSANISHRLHPAAHRAARLSMTKPGAMDSRAAMDLEESLQRLEELIELLKKKAAGCDDAYHKGFTKGVCMALLMLQSKTPAARTGKRTKSTTPSSPSKPKRGQLDLF